MGMYEYKHLLHDDTDLGHSGTEYSTNEVNFGVSNPNVRGMSLYFVVTEAFNALTTAVVGVVHGAATAPTTSLIERCIALADLDLAKQFEIPIPPTNLQFMRAKFAVVGTNPTLGEGTLYFGPSGGGDL